MMAPHLGHEVALEFREVRAKDPSYHSNSKLYLETTTMGDSASLGVPVPAPRCSKYGFPCLEMAYISW
jgi:hypothetical protein